METIAFTIMPDHIHILVRLGIRLTLGKAVAKLKAISKTKCRTATCVWLRGFFDRKLRSDDDVYPIIHYIFMNPYRAELIAQNKEWPFFYCNSETLKWFRTHIREACPYPEWLDD